MTFRKSRNYDVINVLIYSEQEMEKALSQALKPPGDVGKGPVGLEMTKKTIWGSQGWMTGLRRAELLHVWEDMI